MIVNCQLVEHGERGTRRKVMDAGYWIVEFVNCLLPTVNWVESVNCQLDD